MTVDKQITDVLTRFQGFQAAAIAAKELKETDQLIDLNEARIARLEREVK